MKLRTSAFTGDPEMDKKLHGGEEVTHHRRTAKIRFGIHVTDGGDGSVGVTLYKTRELAEKALEREFEACGQAYMDGGASEETIEIDLDTGEIVAGVETEIEAEF